FLITLRRPARPALFPYTTLFRSGEGVDRILCQAVPLSLKGCVERFPALLGGRVGAGQQALDDRSTVEVLDDVRDVLLGDVAVDRSEEHTSELQSRENLVCRLLLE